MLDQNDDNSYLKLIYKVTHFLFVNEIVLELVIRFDFQFIASYQIRLARIINDISS